jgi:hypothetical protein
MTIKSQGGIFGRNPTFNDVEVDGTLSIAGTAVPAPADTLVSSDIGSTVQAYDVDTAKLDANQTFTGSNNFTQNVYIQNSSFPTFSLYNAGGERVKLYYDTNTGFAVLGTTVAAPVKFYVNNGEVASFTTSGNLAFPSGNGIDFSATAGTGTSELLSDYEEGTFTPSFVAQTGSLGSITYDFQEGNYIKTGNIVHFFINLGTDAVSVGTGSGFLFVTGLPYSPAEDSYLTVGYSTNFASNNPTQVFVQSGGSDLYVYSRSTSAATPILVNVSDLGTGANDNRIRFSGSYIAS